MIEPRDRVRNPALLVVDMQNDFVRVGAALEVADARRRSRPTGADRLLPGEQAPGRLHQVHHLPAPVLLWEWSPQALPPTKCCWKGHRRHYPDIGREEECTAVVDELAPLPGEPQIEKFNYGAFHATTLEPILRSLGVESVVVTGTVTQICVEETARQAFHHGFRTTLVRDAVSSFAPDLHAATLKNFAEQVRLGRRQRRRHAPARLMAPAPAAAARWARSAGIYGLLVVAVVLAAIFVPGFATPTNLGNVVTQSAALGCVAIGQTFVIAAGLIDLSVGQLLGLVVVLTCALTDGRGDLLLPVALAMVALGAAIGTVHAGLANRLRIEPLILTFGTLSILQGAIFSYTDRSVGPCAPEALRWLANERLPRLARWPALFLLVLVGVLAHGLLTPHALRPAPAGDRRQRRERAPRRGERRPAFAGARSCCLSVGAALGGLLVAGRLGTGLPQRGPEASSSTRSSPP